MKRRFFRGALAALCLAVGCDGSAEGELIVSIVADPTVAAHLTVVEARLFGSERDVGTPRVTQRFTAEGPTPGKLSFPLSLRHRPHAGRPMRIELRGYDSDAANAQVLIERKEIVRVSDADERLFVTLVLGAACLDAARVCTDASQTCSYDGASAGTCTAVPNATVLPLPPMAADAGTVLAMLDASTEAGFRPADPDVLDEDDGTSPVALAPEPLSVCPVARPGCHSDYPCVPSSDGQGYACRGQHADWPMPDAEPGAKTKPRYEVLASERVVRDLVTGLVWQRDLPVHYRGCTVVPGKEDSYADQCTWAEANRYCSQLALGGYRWRLPSKIELESLIDVTSPSGWADLNPVVFPNTSRGGFWTVSTFAATQPPKRHRVSNGVAVPTDEAEGNAARCVRSERIANAPPLDRYVADVPAGTTRDRHTTLEWRTALSPSVATLSAAQAYCRALPGGFRVPTLKELVTLANPSVSPAFIPGFPTTPTNGLQWSTTTIRAKGTGAYASGYGFVTLASAMIADGYVANVRCVR